MLWRVLWRLDALLGVERKRKQDDIESESTQMLKKIAVGVYRPQKRCSAAAPLKIAMKLYPRGDAPVAAKERARMTVMPLTEQVGGHTIVENAGFISDTDIPKMTDKQWDTMLSQRHI